VFGEEGVTAGRSFGLSLHVALRKLYSVVAFALVAFCAQKAAAQRRFAVARNVVLLALYSAAIEVGQYASGVREGIASNLFDVACGAVGGWIGALVALYRPARRG